MNKKLILNRVTNEESYDESLPGTVEYQCKKCRRFSYSHPSDSPLKECKICKEEFYCNDGVFIKLDEKEKINPQHYKDHPSGIECIQITEHMNFCLGNAIKYIWRAGKKDSKTKNEDLKKAVWYLEREIGNNEV